MKELFLIFLSLGWLSNAGASDGPRCTQATSIPNLCYRGEPDFAAGQPFPDCVNCKQSVQNCVSGFISSRNSAAIGEVAGRVRMQGSFDSDTRKELIAQGYQEGVNRAQRMRQQIVLDRSYMRVSGGSDPVSAAEDQVFWNLLSQMNGLCAKQVQASKDAQFICGVRLNKDLWKYKVLQKWPGCNCADGKGLDLDGVCLKGVGEKSPIDERIPQTMRKFVTNLESWGKTQGLALKDIEFIGCTNVRPSRHEEGRSLESEKVGLKDVSPHAEARACDLQSVTFTSGGRELAFTLKNGKGFVPALKSFLKQPGERDRLNGVMNRNLLFPGEIPRGIVDYPRFWSMVESQSKPSGMSESDWFQLRTGIAVQKALVSSGFLFLDPFTDENHENHFHVSVPIRQAPWSVLGSDKAGLAEKADMNLRDRCENTELPSGFPLCKGKLDPLSFTY